MHVIIKYCLGYLIVSCVTFYSLPIQGAYVAICQKQYNLTLYYFDACPHCKKVLDYIQYHCLPVVLKDIRKEPRYKQELLQIGKKMQVPCLIINGIPLYESNDIIEWLKENLVNDVKNE